jgi:hypothetical protein
MPPQEPIRDEHAYALAECLRDELAATEAWSTDVPALTELLIHGRVAAGSLSSTSATEPVTEVTRVLSLAYISLFQREKDLRGRYEALKQRVLGEQAAADLRAQAIDTRLAEQSAKMQEMQAQAATQTAGLQKQHEALAVALQELTAKLAAPQAVPEAAPAPAHAAGYIRAAQRNAAAEIAAAREQAARDNAHRVPRAPQPQRAPAQPKPTTVPVADQLRVRVTPDPTASEPWALPTMDSAAPGAAKQLLQLLDLPVDEVFVHAFVQRSKPAAGQHTRPPVALVITLSKAGARDMLRAARKGEEGEEQHAALRGATVRLHLSQQELTTRQALRAQCRAELDAAMLRKEWWQYFNNSRSVRMADGTVYHLRDPSTTTTTTTTTPILDTMDGVEGAVATQPPGAEVATT